MMANEEWHDVEWRTKNVPSGQQKSDEPPELVYA
jgi:hypothetical protein